MRIDTLDHVQRTIVREAVTACRFGDPQGERFDYYSNEDPTNVASYVATVHAAVNDLFIVQGWSVDSAPRRRGSTADPVKKREDFIWRMKGTGGVPLHTAEPGDKVEHVSNATELELRVKVVTLEMKLERSQEVVKELEAILDEYEEEDEGDEGDEGEEKATSATAGSKMDEVKMWGNLIRDLIGKPVAPANTMNGPGAPTMNGPGDITERERQLIAATRNARAKMGAVADQQIDELISTFGGSSS